MISGRIKPITAEEIGHIKYEMRLAYVISACIFGGAFFYSIYLLAVKPFIYEDKLWMSINAAILLSAGVIYLMNRKYYKDVKSGMKRVVTGRIDHKEKFTSYEAGAGIRFRRNTQENIINFIVIDGYSYRVHDDIYDNVNKGDEINMLYASESELFLGFEYRGKVYIDERN